MISTRKHQALPNEFPTTAGVFLGVGLGGFFDGIVFHQLLQWHHVLSNVAPGSNSVASLRFHIFWDGLFHASTWIITVVGLLLLWRKTRGVHLIWSSRLLVGALSAGFGGFNLVEGIVSHHLLGLHHVNETVPLDQWLAWDLGFLLWGLLMMVAGIYLLRPYYHPTEFRATPQKGHKATTHILPRRGTFLQ